MPDLHRTTIVGCKPLRQTDNKLMHTNRSNFLQPGQQLLNDTPALLEHIRNVLQRQVWHANLLVGKTIHAAQASSVLFLIGCSCPPINEAAAEPCLILNKRSSKVRQPGDLCCPGGSIAPRVDSLLAGLLRLPGSPLVRWEHWPQWRKQRPRQSGELALLFATGLRESIEEMRLNPLRVKLLGPLPAENLVMFRRTIFPLACWVTSQKKFFPNWEVERIVSIPIRDLLDPSRYVRYRIRIDVPAETARVNGVRDFACFLHQRDDPPERLWGATFRITMNFLETVFGFRPPPLDSLPTVEGKIDENYINPNL